MGVRLLKILFFALLVKPLVFFVLGLNIGNRQGLPNKGPAVIAPNHNSHLDTMVLMSLFPLSQIHKVRPVAAADYFLRNSWLAWFSLNVIGIIPLQRKHVKDVKKFFAGCTQALNNEDIIIFFPEGSRGNPEELVSAKKGIFHLLRDHPEVPLIPVVMHGLGRALPRGEALFVPFNCDVIIGDKLAHESNSTSFIEKLNTNYNELLKHCLTRNEAED